VKESIINDPDTVADLKQLVGDAVCEVASVDKSNVTFACVEGNLTIGKVQLAAADLLAVEEGKCLQDVHITAANALLKQQFPERADFQLSLYLQNGRASPHLIIMEQFCLPFRGLTVKLQSTQREEMWSSHITRSAAKAPATMCAGLRNPAMKWKCTQLWTTPFGNWSRPRDMEESQRKHLYVL